MKMTRIIGKLLKNMGRQVYRGGRIRPRPNAFRSPGAAARYGAGSPFFSAPIVTVNAVASVRRLTTNSTRPVERMRCYRSRWYLNRLPSKPPRIQGRPSLRSSRRQRTRRGNVQGVRASSSSSSSSSNSSSSGEKANLIRSKSILFEEGARTIEGRSDILQELAKIVESDAKAATRLARMMGEENCRRLAAAVAQESRRFDVEGDQLAVPPLSMLHKVTFVAAVPFIGFGFVDNLIMIVAGDYIDLTLGVSFGLSTLAAAGLGNLISDVAGVWCGGVIERGSRAIGVKPPNLSRAMQQHRYTKYAEDFGAAIGISIGCILGMFPLLFLDSKKTQILKQEQELDALFKSVFEEVSELLHAEQASLWLIDRETESGAVRLYSRCNIGQDTAGLQQTHAQNMEAVAAATRKGVTKGGASNGSGTSTPKPPVHYIEMGEGLIGYVAATGNAVRIDAQDFRSSAPQHLDEVNRSMHWATGTRSVMAMPIYSPQGEIIGVVQVTNKRKSKVEEDHREDGDALEHENGGGGGANGGGRQTGGSISGDDSTVVRRSTNMMRALHVAAQEAAEREQAQILEKVERSLGYQGHGEGRKPNGADKADAVGSVVSAAKAAATPSPAAVGAAVASLSDSKDAPTTKAQRLASPSDSAASVSAGSSPSSPGNEATVWRRRRLDQFSALDKNGDGVIDREEWARLNTGVDMFSVMDVNGDGVIDREEWEAAARRQASAMDTDIIAFDNEDEVLLAAFCSHIGIAVHNCMNDERSSIIEALRLCKAQKRYQDEVSLLLS